MSQQFPIKSEHFTMIA